MSDESTVSFGGEGKRRRRSTKKEVEKPVREETVNTESVEENTVQEPITMTAGDRGKYLYLDCEFTGLKKTAQLISLALVDADGRSFYAEFTGYKKESLSEWIQDNVVANLLHPDLVEEGDHWQIEGTKGKVKALLIKWLEYYKDRGVMQIVSDCGHYDFVLLIDLLTGDALSLTGDDCKLPVEISPALHDINQDISSTIQFNGAPDYSSFNPDFIAFNLNREEMVNSEDVEAKHNCLHDAYIIKQIHQFIWQL